MEKNATPQGAELAEINQVGKALNLVALGSHRSCNNTTENWHPLIEQRNRTLRYTVTPTGDMLVDGLTKALLRAAFVAFRDQISVVDITDRLVLR